MRVLGIDPGLTRCGMGVVEGQVGRPLSLVDVGVIRTSSHLPVADSISAVVILAQVRSITADLPGRTSGQRRCTAPQSSKVEVPTGIGRAAMSRECS